MTLMVDQERLDTELSELVRTRRDTLRLSLRALAGLTIDPEAPDDGPQVGHNMIDRLEKNTLKVRPTPEQLRGLANALRLPVDQLKDAASAQYFGHTTLRPHDRLRALVQHAERLDDDDLQRLIEIAEAWDRRSGNPQSG